MRRILNSFLQFIEQDDSESIIVAATNNQKLLDQALFRRFDDVLHYTLPTSKEIMRLFEHKINAYDNCFIISKEMIKAAEGLSHAEIARVCDDAIKNSRDKACMRLRRHKNVSGKKKYFSYTNS